LGGAMQRDQQIGDDHRGHGQADHQRRRRLPLPGHPRQRLCREEYGRPSAYIPYGADIPTAFDPEIPGRYGLHRDGYHLLIARMEPENNIEIIVRGWMSSRKDRPLVLIGNPGNRFGQYLMRTYRHEKLHFIGAIYESEVVNSLRHYSSYYFHGHSVGGTNPSLLEAMGCGNLVFAHDNPFNRETLGSCGYYFADAKELTEAIQVAEEDEGELAQRREAAKNRARADYRWSDIVSSYLELLEQTASQSGKIQKANPCLASRTSIP